jgi:hypothetical protein
MAAVGSGIDHATRNFPALLSADHALPLRWKFRLSFQPQQFKCHSYVRDMLKIHRFFSGADAQMNKDKLGMKDFSYFP